MKKKDNLQMNFSDYLKYCRNKRIRGVAVITDKQYIFYSQFSGDIEHDEIFVEIENQIYPNSKKNKLYDTNKKDVYVASTGREMIIYLPESRLLSMSQFIFLEKMLDDVNKYNEDYNEKIIIYAVYPFSLQGRFKTSNVLDAKVLLKSLITKEIIVKSEKIIGKSLDDEIQIECMKYHIDLENCKILIDLYSSYPPRAEVLT